MTTAISVDDATRVFGRTTAIEHMSFDVPENSITGLLGRNGAGKTTIMSIIAGQDRLTSGGVEVLGHKPFENAAVLSNISYVRDNQRYPDDYKIHHVLRIAPDFAPNWSGEVAGELAEAFRIPTKTRITKFSRGQLSAVAIVLGIASRASVTLLDEPYLGLDVTARGLFHDALLRDYAVHPRTILLSTHLIEESERLFDRVVIVDGGRVEIDAESDSLRDRAFTLSGNGDAIDLLTQTRKVTRTHSVGALKSVTVEGRADEAIRSEAKAAGVQIAPVSLQDLVAAVGERDPETMKTTGTVS